MTRSIVPRATVAVILVAVAMAAVVEDTKAVFGAIGVAGLVLLLLVPRRAVAPTSVAVILALAYAVAAPSAPLTGWLVTSGVAILLTVMALIRGTSVARPQWVVVSLLALFYLALGIATVFGTPANLSRWLFALIVPLCIGVLVTTMPREGLRYVALAVVTLSIVESGIAAAEVTVLHAHAPIWGYPVNSSGVPVIQLNPLVGGRLARAQGSVGHPLVLGFVLAVGFVLTWIDVARIRPVLRWPALAIIAGGLALSGTRSALLAAGLGVLLVLFTGRDVGRKVRAVFVVAFAGSVALVLSASITAAADQVLSTGSFTHRVGALDAVAGLMGRSFAESVVGSGMGSERSLFLRGLLQTDGFYAIDNELVTALATAGIVGLSLLVLVCIIAVLRAVPRMRGLLVTVFVMFFSFDVTSWSLGATVLALVLAMSLRRARPRRAEDEPFAQVAAERQSTALIGV